MTAWRHHGIDGSDPVDNGLTLAVPPIDAARTGIAFRNTLRAENIKRPALKPRQLEMKVRVNDLQKRSSRPKLAPRLAANRASEIALPKIKKQPRKVKKRIKENYDAGLGLVVRHVQSGWLGAFVFACTFSTLWAFEPGMARQPRGSLQSHLRR